MSLQAREDARARLRPFGIVFEKSLHDLIRGIRNSKDPTTREKYIRDALADCRLEVRNPDMDTKTMAILKLSYLEMYGYDMGWASFHVLEVMSSSKFQQKRVGYLAAIQSFRTDTDVLMLTTNSLKKDLGSSHYLDISVALSGVASIVTPSLAQDLSDDIVKMLNHSKPYIRKKAVLAMYKIFLQFPEALRTSFPRLKDKLEDPDSSVVSATVNVICELAKRNSKNYIALAPQLYELLTTSNNNWMLIKILKLFSSLSLIEPRLKPKLLPPILQVIDSTTAKSLLYECVNCIVSGGMLNEGDVEVAKLCVGKLRTFLEESDQNLKFVGLLAFCKIIKIHPSFVYDHQDIILECIDDPDLTIRQRVLDLIGGILTEDNVESVVQKLMQQLTIDTEDQVTVPRSYRVQVISKILETCSRDTYAIIPDFEWYVGVLVQLAYLADGASEVGPLIAEQLRNVAVRVKSVRPYIVQSAAAIISGRALTSMIPATAWVLGEYSHLLANPVEVIYTICGSVTWLDETDESAIAITIQCLAKIYASYAGTDAMWTDNRAAVIRSVTSALIEFFERYSDSAHFEIQERAVEFLELFKLLQQSIDEHPEDSEGPPLLLSSVLTSLFNGYELNPVAPNSQLHISLPEGLDLDTEIYPPYLIEDEEDEGEETLAVGYEQEWKSSVSGIVKEDIITDVPEEEIEKRRFERLERLKDDPFYISVPSTAGTPLDGRSITPEVRRPLSSASPDVDSIPISRLDIGSADLSHLITQQKPKTKKKKTKVEIIQDEKVEGLGDDIDTKKLLDSATKIKSQAQKSRSLLKINSNGLENFDLESPEDNQAHEEVEQLREEFVVPKAKSKSKKPKTKSKPKIKSEQETSNASQTNNTEEVKPKKVKRKVKVNKAVIDEPT